MSTAYCTMAATCPDARRCHMQFSPNWDKMCWRASGQDEQDPPGPAVYPKLPQPPTRLLPRAGATPEASPAPPELPDVLLALDQPWAPGASVQELLDEDGRRVLFVPLIGGRRYIISREGDPNGHH